MGVAGGTPLPAAAMVEHAKALQATSAEPAPEEGSKRRKKAVQVPVAPAVEVPPQAEAETAPTIEVVEPPAAEAPESPEA